MSKVILGIAGAAAVAGWAIAGVVFVQNGSLSDELEASEANRSKLAQELGSAQAKLDEYVKSSGQLDAIGGKVSAAEQQATQFENQLKAARETYAELTKKTQTSRSELAAVETRLAEQEAKAARVEQDLERAENRLTTLRAETDALRQELEVSQGQASNIGGTGSSQAPPVQQAATRSKGDRMAQAKERFELVDQNGDGRIDEFEYRFASVQLLGLIDVNEDGYIMIDETVLGAEAFKRLDQDGDGRISDIEFNDARVFREIDRKGRGYITLEDFLEFMKAGQQ